MGAAFLKGLQAEKTSGRETEGAAKHFFAFHNSQGGIHGTHSMATSRELQEVYGKPFQAAISKAGLKGVMPCYSLKMCIRDSCYGVPVGKLSAPIAQSGENNWAYFRKNSPIIVVF